MKNKIILYRAYCYIPFLILLVLLSESLKKSGNILERINSYFVEKFRVEKEEEIPLRKHTSDTWDNFDL